MRLIDADSLIHLVTDSTILGDGFKTAFCALVNGEPTVKAQKTGEWIDITKSGDCFLWKCSECGDDYIEDTDYCPSCGAYMRGEKE